MIGDHDTAACLRQSDSRRKSCRSTADYAHSLHGSSIHQTFTARRAKPSASVQNMPCECASFTTSLNAAMQLSI